jgi:hypothetical protein
LVSAWEEDPVRGAAIPDVPTIKDPLLRAIAELREQVDRAIDEQKSALGGFLAGLEEDVRASNQPQPAAIPIASSVHAEPPAVAVTVVTPSPSEPSAKGRRPAATPTFDRVDPASPTPPRPGVANGPSDNPRERLDALAKHLDRKLRQANGSAGEPAAKASE